MSKLPQGNRRKVQKITADRVDNDARREAAATAAATLEEETRIEEHRRSERFRKHISHVSLVVVWFLVVLFCVAMLVLAFHYLTPKKWAWLDQDQLDTLRTIVFSGAITSTATAYFVKRVT